VLTRKIEGPFGKKKGTEIENSLSNEQWGVGAHGQLTWGSNGLSPKTKYKRSKDISAVTYIANTVLHLCIELLQLSAQSLVVSPSTSQGGETVARFQDIRAQER